MIGRVVAMVDYSLVDESQDSGFGSQERQLKNICDLRGLDGKFTDDVA